MFGGQTAGAKQVCTLGMGTPVGVISSWKTTKILLELPELMKRLLLFIGLCSQTLAKETVFSVELQFSQPHCRHCPAFDANQTSKAVFQWQALHRQKSQLSQELSTQPQTPLILVAQMEKIRV